MITQNFEKPEWKSHFDQVLKLHQDKQKAATLNEAHNAAIAATDAVRTAVYVQLSRIEENKARLAVITAYIADGPALAEKLNREKDELVTAHEQAMAARHAEFVSHVRSFTDMQKRGGEVDELTITYPSTLLPEDVIIIDTPGVNTTTEANRKKAWEAINNYSDACIVVSDTQQAMSASTRDFVSQVSQVVPHLMLVLTKIDRALENAGDDEDAEAQVAESIELGCAGFAQSMGRSAMHILAFAVASKPALDKKTPQAVERFASELKRLFAAIAAERSIAVGSRCARTLQNVLEKSAGVVEATENEGRRRLAQLEAQSITDPKDFCTARLQEVNGRLNQEAAEAARIMSLSTTTHLRRYKNELLELVIACDNPKELVAAAEEIEEESSSCIDRIIRRSRDETDSAMGGRLSALIEEVRIVLRKRYQIGQSISHATPRDMPMRPLSAGASLQLEEIGGLMKEKVNAFVSKQNSVKMGGIMAGPLFLANPLLGVAALGITLLRSANAPSFDSVRSQCAEAVAAIVDEAIDSAQTETRPDRVAAYFAEELKKILLADVKEFKGWINDVIAAERKELNRVRTEMADFTSVRSKLTSHNNRLSQLLTTAFAESSGLSRRNPQPTSP